MRLKFFLTFIFIFLLSLLMGACSKTTCGDSEWQDILWKLKSYGPANNLHPVEENASITVQFNNNNKQVSGSGGCNSYFGTYKVNRNCELEITGLSATERACLDPALMQQEQTYFNLLQNASQIEVIDKGLQIVSGTELLVYTR